MDKRYALVVEDDKDEATIFARALRTAGFEAEIVRSGDTALARLTAVVPDVVLLDLNLPKVAGGDVLHQIRADPRLSETRVIIVTGAPQRAEVLRSEADLVLIKPIGFTQLCDMAARLVPDAPPDE
jgi:DNA-binding response OmpR family regulator